MIRSSIVLLFLIWGALIGQVTSRSILRQVEDAFGCRLSETPSPLAKGDKSSTYNVLWVSDSCLFCGLLRRVSLERHYALS